MGPGRSGGRGRYGGGGGVPAGPPKREDFERLITRCLKKDTDSIFKEPVTEATVSDAMARCAALCR